MHPPVDPSDDGGGDVETTPDLDAVWHLHHRYLTGLATRIVHDPVEAQDLVQEGFARLSQANADEIDDVGGWLAVVVRRLALDRIRSAHRRRETVVAPSTWDGFEALLARRASDDPQDRVSLDDQVQEALAVVLHRLTPAERTSLLLHDVFGFPFAAVGEIVGRSPAACRQLASRARRSVQTPADAPGIAEHAVSAHDVVAERFIAACATGDLDALVAVLDPDVAGEATVLDTSDSLRFAGRTSVARQAIRIFGPDAGRTLVPLPSDGYPCFLAMHDNRLVAALRPTTSDDNRLIDLKAILTDQRFDRDPKPAPDSPGDPLIRRRVANPAPMRARHVDA